MPTACLSSGVAWPSHPLGHALEQAVQAQAAYQRRLQHIEAHWGTLGLALEHERWARRLTASAFGGYERTGARHSLRLRWQFAWWTWKRRWMGHKPNTPM